MSQDKKSEQLTKKREELGAQQDDIFKKLHALDPSQPNASAELARLAKKEKAHSKASKRLAAQAAGDGLLKLAWKDLFGYPPDGTPNPEHD